MFNDCRVTMMDSSANGSVSGSDSRIVIGWSHDSNCAARIRYMNTSDSTNAMRKFCAGPSELARPSRERGAVARSHVHRFRRLRHRVHRRRLRNPLLEARVNRHLPLPVQPVDVARRRARRESAMFSSGTLPSVVDGTVICPIAGRRRAAGRGARRAPRTARPLIVCGDLVAAHQQAQRLGRVGHLDAEIGRLQAIEVHRQLRLADVQRRVDVDDAVLLRAPVGDRAGELLELARSGPLIVNWISAFWLPPPPIVATACTPVRRLRRRTAASRSRARRSMTAN
jgi:hypothetical protein